MIRTTRELVKKLTELPVEDNLLIVDEDDNEYVVDAIIRRKLHDADDSSCYALRVKKAGNGCIK